MKRVVYTVAIGKAKYAEMAMGLGRSLSLIGDPTPRVVLTDIKGYDWQRYFDHILEPRSGRSALDKLTALEYLDADAVLAIDGDSLVFKKLDPIFEHCAGMPFAIQGHHQSSGTWHGANVAEMCSRYGVGALPSFNGGMLYYERSEQFSALYKAMRNMEASYAATGFEAFRGGVSEEVCVALAMLETKMGAIVPDELGFMNTAVGLIGRLRLDVLKNECSFVCRRHAVRFVEPYIFHASRYGNFLIYWRQLEALKRLERFEDNHKYGHMSSGQKLQRSIQRRYLKHIAKKL